VHALNKKQVQTLSHSTYLYSFTIPIPDVSRLTKLIINFIHCQIYNWS